MSLEDLKLAREKLDPNNIENGLPGRENKIQEIYSFLYARLKLKKTTQAKRAQVEDTEYANVVKHDNNTLMVCGVPGTGKTVTVNKVINHLDEMQIQPGAQIDNFRHVYVNAQHITQPNRIYSQILYKMTGQNQPPVTAQSRLDQLFLNSATPEQAPSETKRRRRSTREDFKGFTVIVIDELDLLYSQNRQSVFYSLFDWPARGDLKVIIIGIANAMDLSEKFVRSGRSRCGWEKCIFEPYSSENLHSILLARLGEDLLRKTFDPAAISIATKRIGRATGDARRILDTCKLAIDESINRSESTGIFTKVTAAIVDKTGFHNYDVLRANFVKTCRPLQLFILKAILIRIDKQGEENLDTIGLQRELLNLMKKDPLYCKHLPSTEEYRTVIHGLASNGMITLENKENFNSAKFCLNDDNDALKDLIRSENVCDRLPGEMRDYYRRR